MTHYNSLNMSPCFAVRDYKMFVFINNRIKMPTAAYFLRLGPTQRVALSWFFETDWSDLTAILQGEGKMDCSTAGSLNKQPSPALRATVLSTLWGDCSSGDTAAHPEV